MAVVDWPEAPTDVVGVDGAEESTMDAGSRCSPGPARRLARRGACGRADEQQ
ncbi:hypothetical protein Scep_024075 [Stephania cephalantha]|uniref:Uncharacterized protein n=1 Tax=Stephania cephalantha TaxID=152367 RepID=A0AAP0EVV2_9MAGN